MKQQLQGAFTAFVILLAAFGAWQVISKVLQGPQSTPESNALADAAPDWDPNQKIEIGGMPSFDSDDVNPDYDWGSTPDLQANATATTPPPGTTDSAPPWRSDPIGSPNIDTSPVAADAHAPIGNLFNGASDAMSPPDTPPAVAASPNDPYGLDRSGGYAPPNHDNAAAGIGANLGGGYAPPGGYSASAPPVDTESLPLDMIQEVIDHPRPLERRLALSPTATVASLPPEKVRDHFKGFMDTVVAKLNAGEILPMYDVLSRWYDDPRLTKGEKAILSKVLDQATRTVIYSRAHLLERPHVTRPYETVETVAASYGVPAELLAKINGVGASDPLPAGTQLKVLRGPFEAIVDLSDRQLVLVLGGRYAGRFPIGVGDTMLDENGECRFTGVYRVRGKERNPTFSDPQMGDYAGDDPENPYAGFRIDLGAGMLLHATPMPEKDVDQVDNPEFTPGFVCMHPEHMADVFDILSEQSTVTIQE